MKVKQLIKKLQKFNPESEVMIKELACQTIRSLDEVFEGWYIDDGFDTPDIVDEHPEDYDIDPKQEKIVCLE